jgi:hypothetical protein
MTRVEPLRIGLPPGDGQRQQDVLLRRQGRDQVERLEDEADPVAAQQREVALLELRVISTPPRKTLNRRWEVEPGEAVHQRGLAGAGRPHDGGEFVGVDVDRHPAERDDLGIALAVDLGQAPRGSR